MSNAVKNYSSVFFWLLVAFTSIPSTVSAHGEKALESFVRMRTIQWYDVQFSRSDLRVNDELEITGKFYVAEDWPISVPRPEAAYLNVATPGPVFIRTERYLNSQPTINSVALQNGGDYTFRVALKARMPGRYHIHPFFNLRDAGAVMGPGSWVEISGDTADFINHVQLLSGEVIDIETYGLSNAIFWHALWLLVGTAWLIWWVRRPLFIPRYRMLKAGQEALLVTPTDRNIGKAILVGVVVVLAANSLTRQNHPNAIPLQAGRDRIAALPSLVDNGDVRVRVRKIVYRIPERLMLINAEIENQIDTPLQIGEFSVANVRFMNSGVGPSYDQYADVLTISEGLRIDDNAPIEPGETKTVNTEARGAAWETEKLDGFIRDADSRMGGCYFCMIVTSDGISSIYPRR